MLKVKWMNPEKTTGPPGVMPIAVLKGDSTIVEKLLSCIRLLLGKGK